MNLYATVTSERASKGQGGNNFIEVQLMVGDAKNPRQYAVVHLSRTLGTYELVVVTDEKIKVVASNGFESIRDAIGCKACGFKTGHANFCPTRAVRKHTVVNFTSKEERAVFDSLEEAKSFAKDTNGEVEKGERQKGKRCYICSKIPGGMRHCGH